MSVLTVLAVFCVVFVLAWRFGDTLVGVLPFFLCALGLLLYLLAFFGSMSFSGNILLSLGVLALAAIILDVQKNGKKALLSELKRQFCRPQLWVSAALIAAMCLLLRGEMILEWDGYSFWGPDTKSLYFNDGFAAKYANAAPDFGRYPPASQLVWWWFVHLAGQYDEQYVFFGYYIFGSLLLLSIADRTPATKGAAGFLAPAVACAAALVLPGVACTAWFRAICVDPLMAMLFGAVLSLIVCRAELHPGFWKAKLIVFVTFLALVKGIGLLWSFLAAAFFCLWWLRERREYRFAAAVCCVPAAAYGSWAVFCAVTERTNYLAGDFTENASRRLGELFSGVFFDSGNNWSYIKAYARAFLTEPIHREKTLAIDLSPALLTLILFAAAAALWRFGFIPKNKLRRLLGFMSLCLAITYAYLVAGQLTMFYGETQYLSPSNAVTLMTRYGAPANMGILLLLFTLATGRADGACAAPKGARDMAALFVSLAIIFSCGAYNEMSRRFIFDPLDESRIEKRERLEGDYADFISETRRIPLNGGRGRVILAVYKSEMNPIVVNAVSPVSMLTAYLSGDGAADAAKLSEAISDGQAAYLYIEDCGDGLLELLSGYTRNGAALEENVLYEIIRDGGGGPPSLTRAVNMV